MSIMSNDMVLKEAGLRENIREQIHLYGHVARLPAEDPAHQISFLSRSEGLVHAEGAPACGEGQSEKVYKYKYIAFLDKI